MNIDKHALPTKLLWVDLEMTGLKPTSDVIIEIAAEITDFDFASLASYEAIIKQSEMALASMNEWAAAQHAASGLTDRIRTHGRPEKEVVQEFAALIKEHFGNEPAVLAGNSIHQDRQFIRQWWPEVDALLHYRMFDVTAFKVLMQGKYGVEFEKKDAHRAAGDIRESITELQYYLDWLKQRAS